MHEKPIRVEKPNIINSVVPEFFKFALLSIIIVAVVYVFYFSINLTDYVDLPAFENKYVLILFLTFTFIPLLFKALIHNFTTYYFYSTHISSEFNFIIISI